LGSFEGNLAGFSYRFSAKLGGKRSFWLALLIEP